MKKSREFDNVLDKCLERLLVRGETVEQCLQSFPAYADELKPLLQTALMAKKVSAIQPRPEFKERVRYQFYSALPEAKRRKSWPIFGGQPRWAAAVAVLLALVLAGGGTVAAARGSMPDEPLYPVKLATEQVRLTFTPSAMGKAELYAELADKRVAEMIHMADENKPEEIGRTAQRLDAYLARVADLASAEKMMGDGMPKGPSFRGTPPVSERARDGKETREPNRRARLKATMMRHAVEHPAHLRDLLRTAPESAKPAILRAIAASEQGYEKALESLD